MDHPRCGFAAPPAGGAAGGSAEPARGGWLAGRVGPYGRREAAAAIKTAETKSQSRGFTLVEVLVALLILAALATMSWQGIDAMLRSRDVSQQRLEQQLRLQAVIAQWEVDLAELQDSTVVPALQFDGASLRLTRRTEDGLQLVVWSLRGGTLTRWAGPIVQQAAALQEAWLRSQQLLGNEEGQLRAIAGVATWQLYYWRGNAWSNAQSTGDVVPTATPVPQAGGTTVATVVHALPGGVRLVLAFREDSGFVGSVTRDVRLGPQGT